MGAWCGWLSTVGLQDWRVVGQVVGWCPLNSRFVKLSAVEWPLEPSKHEPLS